jgi:hypothetical protein
MAAFNKGDILVATETFATVVDGVPISVRRGETRVRAGHPLVKGREMWFKVLDVQYDTEQATAAPGEVRGAPVVHAEPRKTAMEVAQATIKAEEKAIVDDKKTVADEKKGE